MANHDPSGKICLVTGAGTGLARAMSLALVGKGAHVIACDLNEKGLAETAAMAKGAKGRLIEHAIDVSDDAQCVAAVALAEKEFGRLDVLVNCAGLGPVYMRHNFVSDPLRF